MAVHTCSSCARQFSSSSNRLRHERLFHKLDNEDAESQMDEDQESNSDASSRQSRETSEASSDAKDDGRWVEIIRDACQQYEDLPNAVWEEPYLSQFLEHMKNYVEEKFQFVHDMGFNTEYEKIQKMIEKNIQRGYGRQEAVDAAWHARRFLVKQIILDHKDAFNDEENDDD